MNEKQFPKITLLILNYNGSKIIPKALDSIRKIDYPKEKIETIVVDNHSSDDSIDIISKYHFVKILRLKKNLAYGAFNLGLNGASGDYCFFLNNDIEFHPKCLHYLIEVFRNNKKAVIAAPAVYDFKTKKILYTKKYISRTFYNGSDFFSKGKENNNKKELIESYTGLPFIKTEFAKSLPFVFDPDYFLYVEDIDLAYRVRLLGHTIYRAPESIIYHEPSSTTKEIFNNVKMNYLIERNSIQTYLKCLETKNLFLFFPYLFLLKLIKLLIQIPSFDVKLIYSTIRAWGWNIKHLKLILKKRKIIQSNRKVSDKLIFKEIGNEIKILRYFVKS